MAGDAKRPRDQWWIVPLLALVAAIPTVVVLLTANFWGEQLLEGTNGSTEAVDARTAAIDIGIRMSLGIVGLSLGWLTWRRIRAMETQAETQAKQAAVAESGQQTDRYSKSIEQIGDDKVNIRIGGLYALAALAQDAPDRFAATTYDVLIAFLREQTRPEPDHPEDQKPPRSGTDVEVCLELLRTHRPLFDTHHPACADDESDPEGEGPHLVGVDLSNRWLTGLSFYRATITNSVFGGSTIIDSTFNETRIANSVFDQATITATFDKTRIADCTFDRAHIINSVFDVSLTKCEFTSTTISGGYIHASISRSSFTEATIINTFFSAAPPIMEMMFNPEIANSTFEKAKITDVVFDADIRDSWFTDATIVDSHFAGPYDSHFDRSTITTTSFFVGSIESNTFDRSRITDCPGLDDQP